MDPKLFSVVGETNTDKSSFITMLSGQKSLRNGTGDGQSCTKQVSMVPFTDTLNVFNSSQLCVLDVPGFNDTSLDITNRQILDSMKIVLAGCGSRKLDVLFIFQSVAESAIRLEKLFKNVESLFGPEILGTCVLIATKSDLLPEKDLELRKETIETFAGSKNVPVVWWVNDSEVPASSQQKEKQVASLRQALARTRVYTMTQMELFESQVEEGAKSLVLNDPTNVVRTEVSVPYDEEIKYEVEERYTVPLVVRRYDEADVIARAKQMQSMQQNKEPYTEMVKKIERVLEPQIYTAYETHTVHNCVHFFLKSEVKVTVPVQRLRGVYVDKEMWECQVMYRDRPLEHFAAPLRNETVTLNEQRTRKVWRTRTERRTRTDTVITYRRDWTCYRAQAAKNLVASLSQIFG